MRIVMSSIMSSYSDSTDLITENMRARAIKELKFVYESIYMNSRLPLSVFNRRMEENRHYIHRDQQLRAAFSEAAAIGSFAVRIGAITSADQLAIMYEFFDNHPEFIES